MKTTTAALPEDVWSIVAGHMRHRDWAKVCGMCRATFRAPLINQDKAVSWNPQELCWIAKRGSFPEVIRFHDMAGYEDALSVLVMTAGSLAGSAAEVEAIKACSPTGSFRKLLQIGVSSDYSS